MTHRSKLVVDIDNEIHLRLKKFCHAEGTTQRHVVENLLLDFQRDMHKNPKKTIQKINKVTHKIGGRGTTDG